MDDGFGTGPLWPLDARFGAGGARCSAEAKVGGWRSGFGSVAHAAGITRDKTLSKMLFEQHWQSVIDVNLKAVTEIDTALLSTDGALHPAYEVWRELDHLRLQSGRGARETPERILGR